jgi:hypothetical protein
MSLLVLFQGQPAANTLTWAGIASGEALGAVTLLPGTRLLSQTGIGSGEALGAFTLAPNRALSLVGIASSEALGPIAFTTARSLAVSGIPTSEAWGVFGLNTAVSLSLAGISSGEALGAFTLAPNRALSLSGLASAEALGAVTLLPTRALSLGGIPSGEALGTFSWSTQATLALAGMASLEAFGLPYLDLGHRNLAWMGIPSQEKGGRSSFKVILSKRVTTFPNGQILTSLALSPQAISNFWQTLTCAMLGIDTTTDELCYSKVRLEWPTSGQPAWKISEDVTFLKVTEEDDSYNRIRDRRYSPNGSTTVLSEDVYTRVWRVSWACYGPNSFDNARLIKSALMQLDYVTDQMAQVRLYLVTDIPATTRAPEKFQGQWWERTDLSIKVNEQVEESLTVPTIQSAQILLENEAGMVKEINIP